jgi:hypothetical protein
MWRRQGRAKFALLVILHALPYVWVIIVLRSDTFSYAHAAPSRAQIKHSSPSPVFFTSGSGGIRSSVCGCLLRTQSLTVMLDSAAGHALYRLHIHAHDPACAKQELLHLMPFLFNSGSRRVLHAMPIKVDRQGLWY